MTSPQSLLLLLMGFYLIVDFRSIWAALPARNREFLRSPGKTRLDSLVLQLCLCYLAWFFLARFLFPGPGPSLVVRVLLFAVSVQRAHQIRRSLPVVWL